MGGDQEEGSGISPGSPVADVFPICPLMDNAARPQYFGACAGCTTAQSPWFQTLGKLKTGKVN